MLTTLIVIVVALYLGLTLLLFLFQARFIYFPVEAWAATPARVGLSYETVELTTSDGVKLSAWFIPAPEARQVILFFHGNAGNISHRLTSIEQFHQLGLHVFILDYRGYGQSEGSPGETGIGLYLAYRSTEPPRQSHATVCGVSAHSGHGRSAIRLRRS